MIPSGFDDCFEVLGLRPSASWIRVRARYRRLVFLHHPDRNGNDPYARAQFQAVTQAYRTLSGAFVRYGLSHPVGRCPVCGAIAELARGLDGNAYCGHCAVDRWGRFGLPAPPVSVVSCVGVATGLLTAAALLIAAWRAESLRWLVAAMVLAAMSLSGLMVRCLRVRYTVTSSERQRAPRTSDPRPRSG